MDNENIFLSKDIIQDRYLTDDGLLVYVALRRKYFFQNCLMNKDRIHIDDLYWLLTESDTLTSNYKTKLRAGLQNLHDLDLLRILNETPKVFLIEFTNDYFFSTKSTDDNFSRFVCVRLSEVLLIMNSREKFRDKMLRYFIAKICTINNSDGDMYVGSNGAIYANKVGCQPIDYCALMAQIDKNTAIDYDKWFEEHNMLCILRSEKVIVNDKTQIIEKGFTNCYSRPEDIENLMEFFTAREARSNMGVKLLNEDSNHKRRMAQLLRLYHEGKRKASMELVQYIEDKYCHRLRSRMKGVLNTIKNRGKCSDELLARSYEEYYEYQDSLDYHEGIISEMVWNMYLDDDITFEEIKPVEKREIGDSSDDDKLQGFDGDEYIDALLNIRLGWA